MTEKINYFNELSANYHDFRPNYPSVLFQYLASLTLEHELVWDVATGTGQAAIALTKYFRKIIATDSSSEQIQHADQHPQVDYRIEPAEHSSLRDSSVDLITVAQAFHWFDHPAFFKEAQRVLKSKGIFAIWGYGLSRINPEIDSIIDHFYTEIVGPYWPPERKFVETHYQTIAFPMDKLPSPSFSMQKTWSFQQFIGYLATWSAVRAYEKQLNQNPLNLITDRIQSLWAQDEKKIVRWPLFLLLGQKP